MPKIEFVGQSAQNSGAISANSSRLLNTYREPVDAGGLTRYLLKPVLAQNRIATLGTVFQRALAWVDGRVYSVTGGGLYQIDETGDYSRVGDIEDGVETSLAGNTGSVAICAGGRYYVWDGVTLTEPTAGAFSSFGSVETLANYTLLTEKNGRRIQWSAVADPTSLDGSDYATTESRADKNIRGVVVGGNYWVFKQRSIEIYYPTGVADGAFARASGGVMDTGLRAFNLVTKARDAVFFVGSDGIVYLTTGQGMTPVSTRPVELAIGTNNPTHCFYYEEDGHKFCVVRFADQPAWVYDIATNEWHERSEEYDHRAWSAVASVESNSGAWMVGSDLGDISVLGHGRHDKSGPLFRRIVSRTLELDDDFRVPELEFYAPWGLAALQDKDIFTIGALGGYVGFADGYAYDMGEENHTPTFRMRVSGDGGNTFGLEESREIPPGSYGARVIFRSLGRFRRFTVQVDISSDFSVPLYADARVRIT